LPAYGGPGLGVRRGDGDAEYLKMDATMIRVAFVVLALLGGAGVPIYLAMWLIVPKQPENAPA
jgi:phage shock protein C